MANVVNQDQTTLSEAVKSGFKLLEKHAFLGSAGL